jgi:hypothetical protein
MMRNTYNQSTLSRYEESLLQPLQAAGIRQLRLLKN